jgi:hypothetical protein
MAQRDYIQSHFVRIPFVVVVFVGGLSAVHARAGVDRWESPHLDGVVDASPRPVPEFVVGALADFPDGFPSIFTLGPSLPVSPALFSVLDPPILHGVRVARLAVRGEAVSASRELIEVARRLGAFALRTEFFHARLFGTDNTLRNDPKERG